MTTRCLASGSRVAYISRIQWTSSPSGLSDCSWDLSNPSASVSKPLILRRRAKKATVECLSNSGSSSGRYVQCSVNSGEFFKPTYATRSCYRPNGIALPIHVLEDPPIWICACVIVGEMDMKDLGLWIVHEDVVQGMTMTGEKYSVSRKFGFGCHKADCNIRVARIVEEPTSNQLKLWNI